MREQEYEMELVVRRYEPHNGSLTEHPDEVRVVHSIKVFNPETMSTYDILDSFKEDVYDRVTEDLEVVQGLRDDMDPGDALRMYEEYHPQPERNETGFDRVGL